MRLNYKSNSQLESSTFGWKGKYLPAFLGRFAVDRGSLSGTSALCAEIFQRPTTMTEKVPGIGVGRNCSSSETALVFCPNFDVTR
jgi:hypothetical protein